jgi:uncharacterized protein (DUF697 family)/tellurite resistance protein
MNPDQQKSILIIALLAAFADGNKDDCERERISRLAESLADRENAPELSSLYQDVLLKRVTLSGACAALDDPDHRQLAYEMAVCVCDADGAQSDAEQRFLAELKTRLGLDAAQTAMMEREAHALTDEPLSPLPAPQTSAAVTPGAREAGLDQSILNYSLLNGALELLPQSWASMAIIPLQIKMVYRIGGAYGHQLDKNHIKEFLATVGVGLTSQYLEQAGRKLLGGLLGKVAGKMAGGLGRGATGVAFSFATTYALGQIAKRYYAGGRQMSAKVLRDSFSNLLGPARQLQTQYLTQIQQKSGTIDATRLLALVRNA